MAGPDSAQMGQKRPQPASLETERFFGWFWKENGTDRFRPAQKGRNGVQNPLLDVFSWISLEKIRKILVS